MILKKIAPQELVCPHPGAINIIFDIFHYTAWLVKAKFDMKHPLEGETNVYINNSDHMTKMAAMPIYGKLGI